MNIQYKHASHVIIIEDHAFKADDHGRWDLTDIWQTLKLPKGKAPGQWRTREAERLLTMQNLHSERAGRENRLCATKRAALEYAAWVSPDFKDVVFDAFEAVLEMPEVASLVAEKMARLGHDHSADIVKRMVFNDRCDWNALKGPRKNSQKGLTAAVMKGNLTPARAAELGWKGRESIPNR